MISLKESLPVYGVAPAPILSRDSEGVVPELNIGAKVNTLIFEGDTMAEWPIMRC